MDYRQKTCRSDVYIDADIKKHFNLLYGTLRYISYTKFRNNPEFRCNAPLADIAFLPQLLPSNPAKFDRRIWQEVNGEIYQARSPKIEIDELIKISVISLIYYQLIILYILRVI